MRKTARPLATDWI